MPGTVLAAVDDLFFAAKIDAAARAAGVPVAFARNQAELLDKARSERPALIVVDLNSGACRPVESIRALKSDPATQAIRVIAFLSHVQTELKEAAVAAGADTVLPRSAFSANLAALLQSGGEDSAP